jgi:hypothetical protein
MVALGFFAFSFVLAAEAGCPQIEMTAVESVSSAATKPARFGERTIFVQRDAIATTGDISEIKIAHDSIYTWLLIKYAPEPATRLLQATSDHDGLKLALLIDDQVLLAFTWQGPYGIGPEGTQLSLTNVDARAEKLLESLRGCPQFVSAPSP